VIVPGRDGLAEQYRSRIEDITADNMSIAMPMSKGYPVLLQRGELFFGRAVSNSVAYEFTSTLVARQMYPLPIWIIAAPYNIKKIQQRSFVRIELSLPVQVTRLVDDQSEEEPTIEAVTKDISGGGVQIATTHQWELGTKLLVTVHYPEIGPITFRSEVVRIQQPQPDRVLFWVGVKFLEVNEKDRGNIIKFIFKKQLEQRRKGLD
jgi:c-di-GMP-binding flagellar brake protein YcgR